MLIMGTVTFFAKSSSTELSSRIFLRVEVTSTVIFLLLNWVLKVYLIDVEKLCIYI